MNHFVERLPWRIASLAGLVVGGVSLVVGTDPWQSLLRVGVAFAVFGLAGMGLRALLRQGQPPPGTRPDTARGAHVDQTTPPMSVEDVARPSSGGGIGGDESEL